MSWFKEKKFLPLDHKGKANSIKKQLNGLYTVHYRDHDGDIFRHDKTLVMNKDGDFVWRYDDMELTEEDQKYFDSLETAIKANYLEAAQRAIESVNKNIVENSEVNV